MSVVYHIATVATLCRLLDVAGGSAGSVRTGPYGSACPVGGAWSGLRSSVAMVVCAGASGVSSRDDHDAVPSASVPAQGPASQGGVGGCELTRALLKAVW